MIKISDTEYFSNDKTIRFLNMDCNVFMAGCKDNEFDLIHNDPPYRNENKPTKWMKEKLNGDMQNFGYKPNKEHFFECFRVSKNQVIWGANNFELDFAGFVVWDKNIRGSTNYSWAEIAFLSSGLSKTSIITKINGEQDKIHPTEKPVELYKWILDNYTKPTDTILDCFGGSMSNAIACHMKRRKLTIIELDVDYFKSALNRFEIYERQVEDIKDFGYAKTKLNALNPTLF